MATNLTPPLVAVNAAGTKGELRGMLSFPPVAISSFRVLLASLRTAARSRWPVPYGQARNALALCRWLAAQRPGAQGGDGPYDDAFWDHHSKGDWAGMSEALVRHFSPAAVVDVGCGQALLLAALKEHHPSIRQRGIDSSDAAVRRARQRGLDITRVDLAFLGSRPRDAAAALIDGFDVAVCLETAEHLPPWSAAGLVRVLTRAPLVVFSAAQPGQGGTSHINEQPLQYWRRKFQREGFDLDQRDEAFREAIAALDLPWWYAANIHVFSERRES